MAQIFGFLMPLIGAVAPMLMGGGKAQQQPLPPPPAAAPLPPAPEVSTAPAVGTEPVVDAQASKARESQRRASDASQQIVDLANTETGTSSKKKSLMADLFGS